MKTKRITSVLLCLTLLAGMLTAAAVTTQAADDSTHETDTPAVGQYSLSQVDTSLLVPHTGKSSELDNSEYLSQFGDVLTDPDAYKEKSITLSCDDELYKDLGFDEKDLSNKAAKLATSTEYQNILSGLTFVDPKEMMLCQSNRSDAYNTYFMSKQNTMINNASELPDDFDKVSTNTDVLFFHDDNGTWNNGPSNGVGIDIDNDGTDEWLYLTLSQKENDNNNMKAGSYVRLRLYDRVASGDSFVWSQLCEQDYYMHSQNYIYNNITYDSSRGYLALTVGDFNADGKEDLAFYAPDKSSNSEAKDASIWIVDFTKSGNTATCQTVKRLYLKDIIEDFGRMGDPWHTWHLPTVALSTTSTRLGEATKNAGAKRYETYDDLVVSVSVPREYNDDNYYLNSVTAIFGTDKPNGNINSLFLHEFEPFDENLDKRMNYVSTVDADLNGDGFKEIVVAGYKEKNMHLPSNASDNSRRYGDLVQGTNYVNIITFVNGKYKMLWDLPMEVKGQSNLSFYNSIEPIPLCAGHYLHEELAMKDQVCIQGVVLNCLGSKISGTPVYTKDLGNNVSYYYITDTQPNCDAANFANVSFDNVYLFDVSRHVCGDDTKVIDYCTSGRYFTASDVDQIVIISSDPVDGMGDQINIDVSVISDFPDREKGAPFSVQVYNDYFDNQHKDEDGTALFVSFIDAEDDTFYYRWTGSYATISAPTLYSIVQVPPYYKESNSIFENTFNISTGVSNESGLNVGLGISGGSEGSASLGFFVLDEEVSFGGENKYSLNAAYNHIWAHEKEVSNTLTLKTEEDSAVCYVMPIVVNTYEILETLNDPEPDTFSLSEPQEPIFTTLSVKQYNEALKNSIEKYSYNKAKAEDYEKNKTTDDKEAAEDYKNQLSPETSAKVIDTEKLAITCSGDPSGYYHDRDELLEKTGAPNPGDQSDTDNAKSTVNITNNSTLEMAGTEITFADVDTNEGEISLSNEISFKVGAKMTVPALAFNVAYEAAVSIGFAAEVGYTGGRTNTNGIGFGVTYYMPERELMDGVSISADDDQYTKTKGRIFHYDPEKDPTYRYNAHSICYQLPDYSIDSHVDDSETNVDMNDGDSVFVHTFYTTGLADPVPAEPPEDFGVQSVRKVGGDAEITLIWNSRHRSDERWADGYNLYVSDSGGNNPVVSLANKEAFIPSADIKTEDYVPADTPLYSTYTVHLKEGFYNPNAPVTFYIAPAYRDKNTGDVTEGTLCAKTTVGNIDNATNGALGIIKQPENYYMTRENNKETATFSLDAQKNVAGGDKVSFIWQTYNRESGKWENSRTDTPENQNTTTFHSKYSFDIPADDKESYVDMGVRCIAEYDNFSVTSDVVTIRYIDQKPEPDPDPDEPPEDPDEPTGLAISDYDGLVAFAKRVNEGENTLDAYLTNNITVPDGSQWTVGIGTEFKSYNGTFNGRGYGIDGLQLNISDNGGLFGIIGKKGVVRDLAIVGSSSQSVPTYSGGIAAINYGTIDHCVSGVNLAKPEEGLRNSTVNGTISGGITAQNKGIITGCRSAAVVNGVCCGGIAGMNDGRIYGCASNGPVGTGTTECAGGIAGENDGSIQSSYISGAVSCKSEDGVKGWIAGKNSSENVDYVLYPTSDDTQAFGSSSAQTGENISDIADSDMKKQLFVKIMNEITDDTVTWVQAQYGDTCLNMGYPTIQGNYLKQRTLSLQNGISVSGMMHSDLQVILEELAAESDAYKAFASKGNVLSAYSVRIVDSHGNRVFSDLWSSGGYQLHIPTNGKSIALFAHNTKGELVTVTADRVENGVAVFTVADIGSFAVIEAAAPSNDATSSTDDSAKGDPADKTTDSNVTGNPSSAVGGTAVTGNPAPAAGNIAVQTGEAVPAVMLLLLLGAICVFMFMKRRSQEQDK